MSLKHSEKSSFKKKRSIKNACLAYHPVLFCNLNQIRESTLESHALHYKLQECYQGLSLNSRGLVFSLCVCVCVFFYRYFKKDKTVWYFSRQLRKAFVSIRRLKTTEMIFIGG